MYLIPASVVWHPTWGMKNENILMVQTRFYNYSSRVNSPPSGMRRRTNRQPSSSKVNPSDRLLHQLMENKDPMQKTMEAWEMQKLHLQEEIVRLKPLLNFSYQEHGTHDVHNAQILKQCRDFIEFSAQSGDHVETRILSDIGAHPTLDKPLCAEVEEWVHARSNKPILQ